MSGNYTIGGSGADYPTINAAAQALDSLGVNGPVVFDIAPGVYNEQVIVGPVQGANDSNRILFRASIPDSTLVTISWPASQNMNNNYTILFNGASYTSFEHITIERTGAAEYARVIDIINGSHYLVFKDNRIIAPPAPSAALYRTVINGQNQSSVSNLTFESNRIENGAHGIWLQGISASICCIDKGNKIINNHFVNQLSTAIYLQSQEAPKVIGNIIESNSTINSFGISTLYIDNGVEILKNKISIENGKGIFINNTSIMGSPPNLIANNFISVGGTATSEGILLDNARWMHVYHNSINIHNTSVNSSALRINGLISANNQLVNNNLVNTGGGNAIYVTANTQQPLMVSDYNNLYVSDTLVGFWQSAGQQYSLSAYQSVSSYENQSVSLDPMYESATDLHASSPYLDNLGTYTLSSQTPVTDDINGNLRHPVTPDIGANEYAVHDLALLEVDSTWSMCNGYQGELLIKLYNAGIKTYADTLMVVAALSGTVHGVGHLPLILPAQDTLQVTITGFPAWPNAGTIPLSVWLDDPWDVDRTNDTISINVSISQHVTASLGGNIDVCDNQSVPIAPTGSFISYLWHDSTTTPQWFANQQSLIPGPNVVWVTAINERGCQANDTILVNLKPAPDPVIVAEPSFPAIIGGVHYTVVCKNLNTTFSVGNFQSINWFNNSSDTAITFLPDDLQLGPLPVFITVSDTNGCAGYDTLAVFVDDCYFTGKQIDLHDPLLFPNPVNQDEQLLLRLPGYQGVVSLRIFNINGQRVDIQYHEMTSDHIIRVGLSLLKPGQYLIHYTTDQGFGVIPLLIN